MAFFHKEWNNLKYQYMILDLLLNVEHLN
jgi:hypothetical protein